MGWFYDKDSPQFTVLPGFAGQSVSDSKSRRWCFEHDAPANHPSGDRCFRKSYFAPPSPCRIGLIDYVEHPPVDKKEKCCRCCGGG